MKKFFEIIWNLMKFLIIVSLILKIFRFILFSFIPTFYEINYTFINLIILLLSIYISYYLNVRITYRYLND